MAMWSTRGVMDYSPDGGGGARPWWSFPTPLGTPKNQPAPGTCYEDIVVEDEVFQQPIPCGIFYPRPPS